jgi:hypothetical protein
MGFYNDTLVAFGDKTSSETNPVVSRSIGSAAPPLDIQKGVSGFKSSALSFAT